ncbi:MAG: Na+/H+ antiporter NhaA [Bergeyella sp.]|nr:Na+/H+ antiporter NhaA [Bergeyella sp.]
MKLTRNLKKFFETTSLSGVVLMLCVIISLLIANSPLGNDFQNFLDTHVGIDNIHLKIPLHLWVNDGLMTVFFLLVGLEIKRELVRGELSDIKNAALPIFAAIGGMMVPALIYYSLNAGTPYARSWGIPMATDIAFSLAILSMLGNKVPNSIKIFLAALAIVDDLGAIIVIAVFYSQNLSWFYLSVCFGIVILLLVFNKVLKVKNLIFYLIPGITLWYFMHLSGIHATIAGVLLALTIPSRGKPHKNSPLEHLEDRLEFPVNFIIMPLFVLVNTAIIFQKEMIEGLTSTLSIGIIVGLCLGKVIGIASFSFLSIKMKICKMPSNSNWNQIIGVGFLAGIGFTMSIFMAVLSYKENTIMQSEAKFSILLASIISGFTGYQVLKQSSKRKRKRANKRTPLLYKNF